MRKAVSYTHLDVYKRQAHMLATPTCLFECYIALARDVAGLNIVDGGLDVYKRQEVMLPAHIVTGQKHKSDNEANSRASWNTPRSDSRSGLSYGSRMALSFALT